MFWLYLVIILYLVTMIIYVSIDFFWGANTDKISAFGAVLGGVGAFFAGFIAIYFYSDWKIIKNYELVKEASLVLLNSVLNINSNLENLLAITNEFKDLSEDEVQKFGKWCDEFSLGFMTSLIEVKSKNNLHHGLVRDFEKDERLFSKEDLEIIVKVFDEISENVNLIIQNFHNKSQNSSFKPAALNKIDLTEYSEMIRPKIKLLNKECKPL